MNTEKNILTTDIKEITNIKTVKATIFVIIGSIFYAIAVTWIFKLGNFFAGGATGTSQIFVRYVSQIFDVNLPLGLIIFLVNVPLFLIGFKHVSKRFAILTLVSILVQSCAVSVFENLEHINPFLEFADNRLLLAILGGGLAGLGASLCLKHGGSSGGIDIISNMMLVKNKASFGKYVFIVDFTIIFLSVFNFTGGQVSIEFGNGIFTLIRLIAYLLTVETIYTSYRPIKIQIITTKADEMTKILLEKIKHGITVYDAIGAYAKQHKNVLEIYASHYELNDYIAIAQYVDPAAFITICPVRTIKGNYLKKTIV